MTQDAGNNGGGDPLFAQLVMMLSTSALQQMGQAPGPGGEAVAADLRAAEIMIDLLEMVERKTAGNLDAEEKRMLSEVLAAIRMAFVRASQSAGPSPAEMPPADRPAEAAPGPVEGENAKIAEPAPSDKGGEEPRFHKTYG